MKKDWEIKKLGDVCEEIYAGGDKPALFSQEQTEDYKIPIYANGITNDGLYGFTKEATEDRECLTISARGTIGFVCVRNKPFVPIVRLIVLVPKQNVYIHYLKYYCQTLSISNTGSSIPQLTVPMIKTYSVMIPPLEEQKRIVKILDEKFAQLETIKANAQTNLQNAKDLFQSQLTEAFSNTTWEKKRLYELCSRIFAGGDKPQIVSKEISETCQIPIYANGITDDGLYGYTNEATVFDKSLTISARGTIGFTCIRTKPFVPIVRLLVLIPNDEINISYLKYGCDTLTITNTGSSIPQLTVPMIKDYKIPLPPLPEQKRIVEELDTLSEKVRQLQEIYTKQIANCEELKQSLLQKAFEGEF